jgi:hypothetical protein
LWFVDKDNPTKKASAETNKLVRRIIVSI